MNATEVEVLNKSDINEARDKIIQTIRSSREKTFADRIGFTAAIITIFSFLAISLGLFLTWTPPEPNNFNVEYEVGEIILTWDKSNKNNLFQRIILGNSREYYEVYNPLTNTWLATSKTEYSFIAQEGDWESGKPYSFMVRERYSKGSGMEATFTYPLPMPTPPQNIRIERDGTSSYLIWEDSDNPEFENVSYQISINGSKWDDTDGMRFDGIERLSSMKSHIIHLRTVATPISSNSEEFSANAEFVFIAIDRIPPPPPVEMYYLFWRSYFDKNPINSTVPDFGQLFTLHSNSYSSSSNRYSYRINQSQHNLFTQYIDVLINEGFQRDNEKSKKLENDYTPTFIEEQNSWIGYVYYNKDYEVSIELNSYFNLIDIKINWRE